ncbi:Bud site selection protein 6 [Mycena sanguinolenta]|uniref:Bud site selection protein 6 n=1 Tax=Mycena sanguinolenta TaxID=230812 RepID=A0A8H6Z7B4_9AGAR|nr:Bud site selection protein 6 [Mycena sanguinolenta]
MYRAYQPAARSSTSSINTSNSSQGGYVAVDRCFSHTIIMSSSPVQLGNPSDVSSAVRNLLLSTKQLQKILTQWSLGQVSETQVSDVYVQVGTDFNTAIQAFAYHRIEITEIHSVPQELRTVLESCLAEDPSPQVLAMFMPEVKQVLVKLLRGLQSRQETWRARAHDVR